MLQKRIDGVENEMPRRVWAWLRIEVPAAKVQVWFRFLDRECVQRFLSGEDKARKSERTGVPAHS